MRKGATVVVVTLVAALTAAVASGGRPVSLVGRVPTLGTNQTWRATLRAPRAPVLVARLDARTLTFRTKRVGPRRYRAAIRLPAPGRWALAARLGARLYRLVTINVVLRTYRLAEPAQLAANPDGSLLVAERGLRNQVTRIDVATGRVSLFSRLVDQPYGLAWDGQRLLVSTRDGIYSVAAHGGRAQRLDQAQVGPLVPETPSTAFYGAETEIGRIDLPTGVKHPFPVAVVNPHTILVAPDGRLLVTDTGNGRILSVDPASGAATTIASGVNVPIPMAFGSAGDVIVAEHELGTLTRVGFDGTKTPFASGLRRPYAMVRALDGNYYVAEVGDLNTVTGLLKKVTPDGQVSTVRLVR
jgi:streptogramin lyase